MKTASSPDERLAQLRAKIDTFSGDRDWGQFHTPKNLSMALSVEVAELMEIFQWMDGHTGYDTLPDQSKQAIEHEVADIFMYLLRFCSVTGIDPIAAAESKLKLNAEKYPVEQVKGKSDKYTAYQTKNNNPKSTA